MSLVRMRFAIFFIVFLAFFFPRTSFASNYVLPYPSVMPGSKFYLLRLTWEEASRYWHFGQYATLSFDREFSDKYLVEAKTLFEYKQYFLAMRALDKSNTYFQRMLEVLSQVDEKKNGRQEKLSQIIEQAGKHEEILSELRNKTPATFNWQEEKSGETILKIHQKIDRSIFLRKQAL